MPRRTSKPPEAMTWAKAAPVIAVSALFDALRFACAQMWFFGPAFAALYCTAKVSGTVGTTAAGFLCTTGAATVGALASPAFATFGFISAMAVGLIGWLTLGLILTLSNSRIFTEHPDHTLWLAGGFMVSEIPIIGSVPALSFTVVKMYRAQIKNDKETLKKYQSEHAAAQLQERQQRAAEFMQVQGTQANQAQQQEAMQEEMTTEEQSENEAPADAPAGVLRFPSERARKTTVGKQNIPDELRRAA